MRDPWVSGEDALRERMRDPAQVAPEDPEASLPAYALAFLAHLRLLIGVPFDYLAADPRVLPEESIRFFHLDRSWTDRLVDGALAVGKVGSREQAHHHAAAPAVEAALDAVEPEVRPLQRGLAPLPAPAEVAAADGSGGGAVSGFLLRSAAVAGWPHMEVRGYRNSVKLVLLRLERLSPSVLLAMFAGVADRIELEEPHHGIQFGVTQEDGHLVVNRRKADGTLSPEGTDQPSFAVGLRDPALRVVEIAVLRRLFSHENDQRDPSMPTQTGSAAFAIELLQPPFCQVFADDGASGVHGNLAASTHPDVTERTAQVDVDALTAHLEERA